MFYAPAWALYMQTYTEKYIEKLFAFHLLCMLNYIYHCCDSRVISSLYITKYIISEMILDLRQANERRRNKVTPSLIGWAQT